MSGCCSFTDSSTPSQSARPTNLHSIRHLLTMPGNYYLQASAALSDMNTMITDDEGLKIVVVGGAEDEILWRSPALSENSELQHAPQDTQSRPALEPAQEAVSIDDSSNRYKRNSTPVSMHVSEPSPFILPTSSMPMAFEPYRQPTAHPYTPPQQSPQVEPRHCRFSDAPGPLVFLSNKEVCHEPTPSHATPMPERSRPHHYAYVDNRDRALEILQEFEGYFGTKVNNVYAWKELCKLSGMPESCLPNNIGRCKDYLKTVYVNIFDLVEARREERVAKPIFKRATELRLYSQEAGKICPANVDGRRGKGRSNPLWRFCLKRWY